MFSKDIGIDLGTANTLIYLKGKGIVLREPSVVAIEEKTDTIKAVGSAAKKMIGRTPGNIRAVRPLRDGVIASFDITANMLRYFIDQVGPKNHLFSKARIILCVPAGVTEVERRAVKSAAEKAGAKNVLVRYESMATAIGAGLPIGEATGSMIVDIGGGTSEIAVISLGGIVTSQTVRVAGDSFDAAIVSYIKKKFNLSIGERTAEEIKIKIGSAFECEEEDSMEIKGRNLLDGLPKSIIVSSREVREALSEPTSMIVDAIRATLENTPPELSADIIDRGIMLSGGGALLRGLDRLIHQQTGINVNIAENPLDCVVEGTGKMLEYFDQLQKEDYDNFNSY